VTNSLPCYSYETDGSASLGYPYRRLTPATFAPIVAAFLPASPWIVAIYRTNWFWGKTPLNLLVLAVVLTSQDRPDRSVAVSLL